MSTIPDADRYSEMNVELVCPKCESAGLIPWQRLDRAPFCRRCALLFRVEAGGLVELEDSQKERISVQVRSSSSEWHDHKAVIEREVTVPQRLRAFAIQLAGDRRAQWTSAGAAILLVVAGLTSITREPGEPPPLEIPTALEDRALLLTQALVRRDMAILIPLTDPAQHRALRIWLAHAKDLPKAAAHEEEAVEPELLSTAKTTPAGDNVDVRLRLPGPDADKSTVLTQRWAKLGEVWYFRPVRLRSPPPPAPAAKFKQRLRKE